jgi:hypothetical protein
MTGAGHCGEGRHLAARVLAAVRRACLLSGIALGVPALAQTPNAVIDTPDSAAPPLLMPASPFEAHFQGTYIWQDKPAFSAAYTGPKSLLPAAEKSYTSSLTAYLALRTNTGGAVYVDPEMIEGVALSNLQGLGGPPNGELQKVSGPNPTFYVPRAFFRQVFGLGGPTLDLDSAFNQLGETVDRNRIVLTLGKVAITDIFDNNSFAHDPRTQFANWTASDFGSYDFAADVRGYSWGGALEVDWQDWALRAGRFLVPRESNGAQLNYSIMNYHGDQIELERDFSILDQPGKLRLLAFRNAAIMGSYLDAIKLARATGTVPSVADVRRPKDKVGWGLNGEQNLTGDFALFGRLGWADGQTETYSFTEVERTRQLGATLKGTRWQRENDTVGVILIENGLSTAHEEYLSLGGLGEFIGDGQLVHYRPEDIFESYYSYAVGKQSWISLDYQHIDHPAYNADRGPVNVYGVRLHTQF